MYSFGQSRMRGALPKFFRSFLRSAFLAYKSSRILPKCHYFNFNFSFFGCTYVVQGCTNCGSLAARNCRDFKILNFDVKKKFYKLPKLRGGGEVIRTMPEIMHFFPQETVPKSKQHYKVSDVPGHTIIWLGSHGNFSLSGWMHWARVANRGS